MQTNGYGVPFRVGVGRRAAAEVAGGAGRRDAVIHVEAAAGGYRCSETYAGLTWLNTLPREGAVDFVVGAAYRYGLSSDELDAWLASRGRLPELAIAVEHGRLNRYIDLYA